MVHVPPPGMPLSLNTSRRQLLIGLGLASTLRSGHTQSLGNRPVRIVVPFGPGGIADLCARAIAPVMGEALGTNIVVENKPGAGGVVAGEQVARAEPDGHTLLLMSNGTAVSAGLFKQLPFDAQTDFRPVGMLGSFDIGLIDGGPTRFTDVAALLAFGKANPGKLNIGTINIGSTQNLAAELFKTTAGITGQIIPFGNTPSVITALRSGDIDVAVEILGPVRGQITAGAVRALAVMGDKRSASFPQVPTLAESGVSGLNIASWNALAAPARTPPAVIEQLHRALQRALAQPDIVKRLADLGVEARPGPSQALAQLLGTEIRRWSNVIREAKIPQQ
jgi:tripartite-type tricarboxylate transporter receptor subunit TctC